MVRDVPIDDGPLVFDLPQPLVLLLESSNNSRVINSSNSISSRSNSSDSSNISSTNSNS